MKKHLLLLTLCACSATLLAQNIAFKPFDNTLGGKLLTIIKTDSLNYKPSPLFFTEKYFKSGDLDFAKNINLNSALIVSEDINTMPTVGFDGKSFMPVKKLEGYSKMPIVGQSPDKGKRITKVNP